jgi:hypothetical protein
MAIQGSCLCGTLRYEVDQPLTSMLHCHCSRCRKMHGAPFATFATAPARALRWLAGADAVVMGGAPGEAGRGFCGTCGSPAPGVVEAMDMALIPVGTLDGDPGLRPQGHLFVASKASWHTIADTLPRYERYPPWFGDAPGRPDLPVRAATPGRVAGSCLCGEVAYELANPVAMYQCHCSRCRKGRGAAHGANLFCRLEDFHWARGAELVVDYQLPEARRFGVAFCRQCGGAVPRVAVAGGNVVVPVSCLDTDPGMRPMAHIFTGSKAVWFEIADELLQHGEGPPGFGPAPRPSPVAGS